MTKQRKHHPMAAKTAIVTAAAPDTKGTRHKKVPMAAETAIATAAAPDTTDTRPKKVPMAAKTATAAAAAPDKTGAQPKIVPMQPTEDFAAQLGLLPQSIRKRYCQTGSYFGVRPVKLANGRLLWPADAFARLTEGA
ncbi:hypothetical protein [Paraburkholderia sp. BR14374]|uniref:hypothetical protein n=1 Tax=Paraburkholderia sp. BR14374 TaxID=3237007 RepID=UPI0034CECDF4